MIVRKEKKKRKCDNCWCNNARNNVFSLFSIVGRLTDIDNLQYSYPIEREDPVRTDTTQILQMITQQRMETIT